MKEPKQSSVRAREPPDRDTTSAPPMKRPRPAALPPVIPPSAVQQAASNNRHSSSAYKQDHVEEGEDDIQEVMPVKSEPRDPVPQNTAVAAVDTSYRDAAGAAGHTGGQVALEDEYQDDSYDYGDYGEGYDDSSGMIGEKLGLFLKCSVDRHCFFIPIGILFTILMLILIRLRIRNSSKTRPFHWRNCGSYPRFYTCLENQNCFTLLYFKRLKMMCL